jgi:hypothetical protein
LLVGLGFAGPVPCCVGAGDVVVGDVVVGVVVLGLPPELAHHTIPPPMTTTATTTAIKAFFSFDDIAVTPSGVAPLDRKSIDQSINVVMFRNPVRDNRTQRHFER